MKKFAYLMCSANEIKIVIFQEFIYNCAWKSNGDSSIIGSPSVCIFIRVGPDQITKQAF